MALTNIQSYVVKKKDYKLQGHPHTLERKDH